MSTTQKMRIAFVCPSCRSKGGHTRSCGYAKFEKNQDYRPFFTRNARKKGEITL